MSERTVYEYAVLRVMPRVEREEFVNVGVALFCRKQKFAQVKIFVNEAKCKALDPTVDLALLKAHLSSFEWICTGDKRGGPLAALAQDERFRWLTAKRSTMLQCSVSHPGTCLSAEATLDELFERLVL